MNTNSTDSRAIHTSLYGQIAYDIIDSIFGQFSDGRWENNRGYDKYWQFAGAQRLDNGEVVVSVSTKGGAPYCGRWLENPYIAMSDAEVLEFLAKKIKFIAKDCIKDNDEKIGWSRGNMVETCNYLDHKLPVTYADIYFLYEKLLGRCNEGKYAQATKDNIVGKAWSDEEAAAIAAKRNARDAANIEYSNTYNALVAERDAEIAAINAKYNAKIDEAANKLNETLRQLDAA